MSKKPISIPPEPERQIPPDLVRAERAAILVILAYGLGLMLLVGLSLLLFWAGPRWFPYSVIIYFLAFVAAMMAPLIYLARKTS
ncbi:hypothetical protein [Maricaulis sp.]|uniref:hypothetical protein n=1 Tax=Maricaulis sp. TaxID=1486257 RepID=UPI003A8C90C9